MSFFSELKRRNIFKVGIAYAVACWLMLQIVDLVLENINAPDWVMQVFMLALAVGFPIAIIMAWAFEVTPDGVELEKNVDRSQSITRHTGRQLNRGIIMMMSVAVVFLLTERFRDETSLKPAAKGSSSISPDTVLTVVKTEQGLVQGAASKIEGITRFLGLPYAAPPAGEARWQAPVSPASWEGIRTADTFGNRCIQTNPWPDMIWNSEIESEDCLYLSIWAPVAAEGLPVMFWIHGGGYASGSGDEGRHDGSVLASKDVIVVTINYRLGVFGFLAHPELSAESKQASSGNYGVLDMIAALKWVRSNIAGFGGDPNNVTIFGESAGSYAVSSLMASPLATDLFHKAIGQSGAQLSPDTQNLLEAEADGEHLSESAGVGSIAELRTKYPAELVQLANQLGMSYSANIDGYLFPTHPTSIFETASQNDVPLMVGWTSAEAKWVESSLIEFQNTLREQYPDDIERAMKVYPAETDAEAFQMAVYMTSDSWIIYPTWKWSELQVKTGSSPVYRYLFDQVMATHDAPVPENDPGAAHATDIPFVFNVLGYTGNPISRGDQVTADLMVDYWTNFAHSGNPNGPGLPEWPVFVTENGNRVMRLNEMSAAETESDRARMEFLDSMLTR